MKGVSMEYLSGTSV